MNNLLDPVLEADIWDKTTPSYRHGKKALNEWHRKCRLRHIEAKINASRKAKGLPPLNIPHTDYGIEY